MQYYKFIRQPDDDWLKYAQKIPPHSQQIFLSKDFSLPFETTNVLFFSLVTSRTSKKTMKFLAMSAMKFLPFLFFIPIQTSDNANLDHKVMKIGFILKVQNGTS